MEEASKNNGSNRIRRLANILHGYALIAFPLLLIIPAIWTNVGGREIGGFCTDAYKASWGETVPVFSKKCTIMLGISWSIVAIAIVIIILLPWDKWIKNET